MELGPKARARGVRLLALEEVDSTNDEARRLIESGERGPLWIAASRQTKGHGRLGRDWIAPPGNLSASFIIGDFGDIRVAPQLGFVIGVAAIRALRACGPQADVALKWPNDLLLDGAKLGGVLLETLLVPTGDERIPLAPITIIGIGVNCAAAPQGLPYEARALSDIGPNAPSADVLLAQLSDALVETLDLWRGGEGFAQLREEWLSYASGLGAEISVALMKETLVGRFESIDATGRLLLATRHGLRAVEAGDVQIGPRPLSGASL